MFTTIRTFLHRVVHGTMASPDKIIHRVKVLNLPPKDTVPIKKLFNAHGIKKYKKAPQWNYAYINFDSENAAKDTMATLTGVVFKKRTLATEYAQLSELAFRERFAPPPPSQETVDPRSFAERLADQVTPLYKMPYEEQLAKKQKQAIRQLRNFRKKLVPLAELTPERKAQLAWIYENTEDPPCQILDPIRSPQIEGYRTKCEFSIGKDPTGQPTVGFLEGLYRDGMTNVLDPSQSIHVPTVSKQIAKAMEQYVRHHSTWPVYDRKLKSGVWRSLMVKAQHTGDVMVLIQMKTSDLSTSQIEQEKQRLVEYWSSFAPKIKTLMVQQWNGDSNGVRDGGTEVVMGDGYVYEHLLGHRFRISSHAFFQVNTPATEHMLQTCAQWCHQEEKKTTLLDLCCGAGSIGITMANAVDRVVGIEMIHDAIEDAKFNANLNQITNAQYYVGKVEEKIEVMSHERNETVVAVLDPPRSGVHSSVIRAVREAPHINKVIFISCDAKQAMQNFISLCRPTSKKYQGTPFKPNRAVTIDLFPHTDHAELMIEFVRI